MSAGEDRGGCGREKEKDSRPESSPAPREQPALGGSRLAISAFPSLPDASPPKVPLLRARQPGQLSRALPEPKA